jgi:hypothetical protein
MTKKPESLARLDALTDIVWLVASEHLNNITNIGLNIGSDGLCELAQRSGKVSKVRFSDAGLVPDL